MAGAAPQIEWYIARDGQQYGPLSDPEMRKFVELGHLRASDLVWRHGFADWRPAPAVFPLPAPPPPRAEPPRPAYRPEARGGPQQPHREPARSAARDHHHRYGAEAARSAATPVAVSNPFDDDDDDIDDDFLPEQPRRSWRRMAIVAVLVALLGGAIWLAVDLVPSPARLVALIEAPKSPSGSPPAETSGAPSEEALADAPLQAANASTEAVDTAFQDTPLWQLIRQEFPEWYQERLKEAAQLKAEGRDDAFIERRLAENVVALRRQHAEQALSASPAALRGIAESFLDNLQQFSAESVQACYGFISQGETSPQVLSLMDSPEHRDRLQRQVIAVFEAVAEGRRSPQTHLPPRQSDYQALTQALTNRGWTDRDVQLFSNPRALAQAPPQEVCRLVQDWFAAQLSITEEDVQLRLLIESLKPVVAG